jgi:hypothetical protein
MELNMSEYENTNKLLEQNEFVDNVGPEYFDHAKKVNDIFYDQIKISDQKAAYIFTFMLAFLISSSEVRGVFTFSKYIHAPWEDIFFSLLMAAASVFSILCAILVVLPRHVNKSTSLFWGTWPVHREIFRQAAHNQDKQYLFNEYLNNADILATIARGKYRCATMAFKGLMVTVVAYVFL